VINSPFIPELVVLHPILAVPTQHASWPICTNIYKNLPPIHKAYVTALNVIDNNAEPSHRVVAHCIVTQDNATRFIRLFALLGKLIELTQFYKHEPLKNESIIHV
jgi:hypothetical protein